MKCNLAFLLIHVLLPSSDAYDTDYWIGKLLSLSSLIGNPTGASFFGFLLCWHNLLSKTTKFQRTWLCPMTWLVDSMCFLKQLMWFESIVCLCTGVPYAIHVCCVFFQKEKYWWQQKMNYLLPFSFQLKLYHPYKKFVESPVEICFCHHSTSLNFYWCDDEMYVGSPDFKIHILKVVLQLIFHFPDLTVFDISRMIFIIMTGREIERGFASCALHSLQPQYIMLVTVMPMKVMIGRIMGFVLGNNFQVVLIIIEWL